MPADHMATPAGQQHSSQNNGLFCKPAPQRPIESQRFFRGSVNYSWWLLPAFVLGLCAWVALLKAVL